MWRARLALDCARRAERSVLVERWHEGPLVIQKPLYPEGNDVCHAIVVHPPGGIAGGDELDIAINVRTDAKLLVTTPGATRWYKANGRSACQRLRIAVETAACVEWLPQENILFDAAHARMEAEITLSEGARYIGWEVCCFGRIASGERFTEGVLRQMTAVRIAGRLVWNERVMLDASERLFASRLGLARQPVTGTMLVAGARIEPNVRDRCREILRGVEAGASTLPEVFVARYIGASAEQCRKLFSALWAELRPAVLGREACVPRIWRT
jgi:urease accessory protein